MLAQRAVDLSPADQGARDVLNTIQEHQRRALHAPAVQPESPERWLALSMAHYLAGRYEECIDTSRQAIRLRPDYAEAYNNVCAAQNALGRTPKPPPRARRRWRSNLTFRWRGTTSPRPGRA